MERSGGAGELSAVQHLRGHRQQIGKSAALTVGAQNVLTRLHRANIISDVFGGAKPIHHALGRFKAEGRGVLVLLRDGTAGVPIVSISKLGETPSGEARTRQWRAIGLGAQILKDLGVNSIRLLTSSHMTYVGISGFGIEIVGTEPVEG
jgi:3,4-dihydroxy 2-butanone 4-phosphate synthase/GTP cyclohydrolase II